MHRTSWIPHCVHGQIGDIGPVVGSVVTEVGLSTILQAVVISLFRGNMRRVNNFKNTTPVFHGMAYCRCVGGAYDRWVSVCLIVHCTCLSSYASM